MKEILRLEQISYQYENKYTGLNKVSAVFHSGERIAVLGGNGAGKSTLFLCCNGVLHPQKGKILLKGKEISETKKDLSCLRQTVGLVFQEPDSQIIAGSVENEVGFGPVNLGLSKDVVYERVAAALKQLNLVGYEQRAPQYLSGGEKKRVSIADIVAMKPEIILLDEPTASLDPENMELLEQTLAQLSLAGITLVVSTHDVDFAYRFATRGIVFSQGKIIIDSAIDEVFASESMLKEAGLKKPLLFAITEMLNKQFPGSTKFSKPKNLNDIQSFIKALK